jgi:hypothetical protein
MDGSGGISIAGHLPKAIGDARSDVFRASLSHATRQHGDAKYGALIERSITRPLQLTWPSVAALPRVHAA